MVAPVLSVVAALLALPATALRVLVAQPALGAGLTDDEVSVASAGSLGLLALSAMLAGAWLAMADERATAPESAYTPPPARPAHQLSTTEPKVQARILSGALGTAPNGGDFSFSGAKHLISPGHRLR